MSENRTTIAFPPPPDSYKKFGDGGEGLMPPHPPGGPFSVFGQEQTSFDQSIPTLESQDIPTLYDPNAPPLFELKKINHQILFAFQKLVGIIATGNESPVQCLEQIKHLFMNAHYLLHKLRTVQAYEHMHHRLSEQKRQLDLFKKDFDEKLEKIANLKPP